MNAMEASYILKGPEEEYDIAKNSIGQILFDCLSKQASDNILNIDAQTGTTITTGQILNKSIMAAQLYRQFHIDKGDTIALISSNTIDYFAWVLGAFYIGAPIFPLNPHNSETELNQQLNKNKVKLALCSSKIIDLLNKIKPEIPTLKHIFSTELSLSALTIKSATFQPDQLEPSMVALIGLSSGTTGIPKSILLTHLNLREILGYLSHPEFGNLTPEDTIVIVQPLFHMLGFALQLQSMFNGMKCIIMDSFEPTLFLSSIEKHRVTKLFIASPIAQYLAKDPSIDDYDLSSLKDVIVGGAHFSKQLQKATKERLKTVTVRQAYGLTETSGPCTIQKIKDNQSGSIGSLIPHVLGKIYDLKTRENLPAYEIGEICFKGPVIMKKYGNNYEVEMDDDGFYHTGDLGYYDKDNCFWITDRKMEIIKSKECELSPTEIEGILLTNSKVKDCGVIGIEDEKFGEVPFAFVVSNNDLSKYDILQYIADRLPPEKQLKGGLTFIKEIPKTPSGKILRSKLKQLYVELKD